MIIYPIATPSAAASRFADLESLRNRGDLHRFFETQIADPETDWIEGDWLEYKDASQMWFERGARVTSDKYKQRVREYLSTYTSAFANTSGGMLVFGINAPDKRPESMGLVEDVSAFRKICESSVREITDPPVRGIKVLSDANPETEPRGLVIVFIPQSQFLPHRSEVGERGYFQRIGDTVDVIRTGPLRAMFYPRVQPFCKAFVRLDVTRSNGQIHFGLGVTVKNDGTATALDAVLEMNSGSVSGLGSYIDDFLWVADPRKFGTWKCLVPIHPEDEARVTGFGFKPLFDPDGSDISQISISFRIFAQDSQPLRSKATFEPEEIRGLITQVKGGPDSYSEAKLQKAAELDLTR